MIAYAPYWSIPGVEHAICCAHLLRELEGVQENAPTHTWAQDFLGLLMRMKAQKERDMANNRENASSYHLYTFSTEQDRIITKGRLRVPISP